MLFRKHCQQELRTDISRVPDLRCETLRRAVGLAWHGPASNTGNTAFPVNTPPQHGPTRRTCCARSVQSQDLHRAARFGSRVVDPTHCAALWGYRVWVLGFRLILRRARLKFCKSTQQSSKLPRRSVDGEGPPCFQIAARVPRVSILVCTAIFSKFLQLAIKFRGFPLFIKECVRAKIFIYSS